MRLYNEQELEINEVYSCEEGFFKYLGKINGSLKFEKMGFAEDKDGNLVSEELVGTNDIHILMPHELRFE